MGAGMQQQDDSAELHQLDAPPPFAFDWAVRNGFSSADVDRGEMPPEIGTERAGGWALGDGGILCHQSSTVRQPVAITGTKVAEQRLLTIRFALKSNSLVRFNDRDPCEESDGKYSILFFQDTGDNCAITCQPDYQHYCIAHVVTADGLRSMVNGQKVPKLIERFIEGREGPSFLPPRASQGMHRIVSQIKANPYTGVMANLYLRGVASMMLAEALMGFEDYGHDDRALPCDHQRAVAARDILVVNLLNPPPIDELAGMVGVSQRRLINAFREAYGMTVSEWLSQRRLDHASELLREGGIPIKEVAFRLSYSNVSSFSHAFTKRFGVRPGSYRREAVPTYDFLHAGA